MVLEAWMARSRSSPSLPTASPAAALRRAG